MVESPYTIVEVGCGLQPFPGKGLRRFMPGDHYIGIDLFDGVPDSKIRHAAIEATALYDDPSIDIRIQRGDGRDLPFEDQFVDELVYVNVFGDSRTFGYQRELRREAVRVMHAAGSLTVVESLSTSQKPLETLVEEMRADGLVLFNRDIARSPATISQYVYPTQKIRMGQIDRAYAATFILAQPFDGL